MNSSCSTFDFSPGAGHICPCVDIGQLRVDQTSLFVEYVEKTQLTQRVCLSITERLFVEGSTTLVCSICKDSEAVCQRW